MWPLTGPELVKACNGHCSEVSNGDVHGAVIDSRLVKPGDLFVAVKGENFDGHTFVEDCLNKGARFALVSNTWTGRSALSREHQSRCVVVDDVLRSFRSLAAFLRSRFPFPVIGVGGSNGKTTTKEMLAALLGGGSFKVTKTKKSENGFLGVAITICDRTHSQASAPHALVLEIGIDEPGAMDEHLAISTPDCALLTALGPEHLAGLGTWEIAVAEEFRLFEASPQASRIWQLEEAHLESRLASLRNGDVVVCEARHFETLNAKIPPVRLSRCLFQVSHQGATSSDVNVSWFSGNPSENWQNTFVVPLPGMHNVNNFVLACATAAHSGRTLAQLKSGWATFIPPEMRSRIVNLKGGGVLYDDCYNASPASMDAALQALETDDWKSRSKVVVLADMLDLGQESKKWHLDLLQRLVGLKNAHLCLYGAAMYDVYQALENQKNVLANQQVRVSYLGADENPSRFVEGFPTDLSTSVVLVKGSRGMALDRVVATVTDQYGLG